MLLINLDLRHVRTGVKLSRAEIIEAEHLKLLDRTAQRQKTAKAALAKHGVTPRIDIGSGHVPQNVARAYSRCSVRGLIA